MMNDKKPNRYILNSVGEPVIESDLLTWAKAFENSDRKVKQEHVGPFLVSTVFLALDHNWEPTGPPILWETMVFLKDHEGIRYGEDIGMDRCSGSREQALAMHAAMIARIASIPTIKEE
jgi:hypothetical protein